MFQEATFEMTSGAFQKESEADKRLFVQFGMHPHLDQEETNKQGRPIYKEKVYVMIMVPGDKDSIVHRPAWQKDFQRFPQQYQNYLNKAHQAVVGTPLKLIPVLTTAQIKELEFFNVYTVEQLAEFPDAHAHRFMGAQSMKQLAKDYLAAAKGLAPITELRADLAKRDSQIEMLQRQIQDLADRLQEKEE